MSQHFRHFLSKNSFIHRVLILAGGTAIGQCISVLSVPIITRLYSPEDLGQYGLFTAFIGTASVGAALLYEPAIVSASSEQEAADLTILCFCLAFITTPIAVLAFWSSIRWNFLGFGSLPEMSIIWATGCYLLIAGFSILKYWFIRRNNFSLLGTVSVFQNIVRSGSHIVLGLIFMGTLGLLSGELLGRAAGIGKMLKQSNRDLFKFGQPFQIIKLHRVIFKYIEYPKYVLPSSIINVIASSLPVPIIVSLHGETAGGHFVLAQRVIAIPLSLIGTSVADVFHNQISAYASDTPNQIKFIFLKTAQKLFIASCIIIIVLGIFIFSGGFTVFFGKNWANASLFLLIILPWQLSSLVVTPLSRVVFVLSGQKYKLIYDFFSLLCQILILIWAKLSLASLTQTIFWISFFGLISYILYFFILLRIINKYNDRGLV